MRPEHTHGEESSDESEGFPEVENNNEDLPNVSLGSRLFLSFRTFMSQKKQCLTWDKYIESWKFGSVEKKKEQLHYIKDVMNHEEIIREVQDLHCILLVRFPYYVYNLLLTRIQNERLFCFFRIKLRFKLLYFIFRYDKKYLYV